MMKNIDINLIILNAHQLVDHQEYSINKYEIKNNFYENLFLLSQIFYKIARKLDKFKKKEIDSYKYQNELLNYFLI